MTLRGCGTGRRRRGYDMVRGICECCGMVYEVLMIGSLGA